MRESFGSNVRFVLMNSFSTSADTTEHLSGTHPDLVGEEGWELLQNKSPKVDAETMDPVEYPDNPDMEWYASRPQRSPSSTLPLHTRRIYMWLQARTMSKCMAATPVA